MIVEPAGAVEPLPLKNTDVPMVGFVGDIVKDAKANPGKLNYGSWSVGNPVHLGSALLESMTEEIGLEQAIARAADLMDGRIRGRILVRTKD